MNSFCKEISIKEIEGFEIGNAEIREAGTGCTVILAGEGAVTGLDVRGGGPASRESALLNPLAANSSVNAVLLSGGSAFGLNAAAGVMDFLEERNLGFPTDCGVVPIVCASCLFDLPVATAKIRPDRELGYQACMNAGNYRDGVYGAGTGATVGKAMGMEHCMKAGIGSFAVQAGDLKIGAVVAVNALGNIVDPETGRTIAGILDDQLNFVDSIEAMLKGLPVQGVTNTTIGVILTNGAFNKTELTKIAGMAHNGYAMSIRPVHTMFDGDSIYAMSKGNVKADINIAGALAAEVMSKAVINAVLSAEDAYGIRSVKALGK